MIKKMLACDVDGTLIFHDDQLIKDTDIAAIKRFTDEGNIFVLCTGRTLTWTIPLLERFDVDVSYLILCNGSMVYKNDDNITNLFNEGIPNNIAQEIIEYYYHQKDFALYWDDGKHTYELEDRTLDNTSSIIQENYSKHITFSEAQKQTTNLVTLGVTPFSADVNVAEQCKHDILNRWGKYVDAFRNQFFIDIAPLESSKGSGITKLKNYLNTDIEVYGIGDSFNDLSMFQTLGKQNSFWMKNGDRELSTYTQYHVNSVKECIDILLNK